MEEKNSNVEFFDDEEIITLYDENDTPVDFVEVACVEYENEFYALLEPVEPVEGLGEGEVIICKLEEQDDETELVTPVMDEELLDKIFNEYLKAAADADSECGCGDDCDCGDDCGCGDDCHCEDNCGCEKDNKEPEEGRSHSCGCGCKH